jgi:hypothetical protein
MIPIEYVDVIHAVPSPEALAIARQYVVIEEGDGEALMGPLLEWYLRMPQQLIATGVHDVLPSHEVNAIIDAIWEGKLEGDIYADGEVWADVADLTRWRRS